MTENNQTTLVERLKSKIVAAGSITVEQYMEACLADKISGYYVKKDPIGAEGDFITSPELSQIFGELIGLWTFEIWQMMGKPSTVHLIELGPGRGTLMSDALRALKIVPEYYQKLNIHLVESSQVLKNKQKQNLARFDQQINWHSDIESLPFGPKIFIANEFFDALPVKQYQYKGNQWFERLIRLKTAENSNHNQPFEYSLDERPAEHIESILTELKAQQSQSLQQKSDIIFEYRCNCINLIKKIAEFGKQAPLALLLIDYGHTETAFEETLQAVKKHKYFNPLSQPGEADITTQVDFNQLKQSAQMSGLTAHGPISQGQFLLSLGLEQRLNQLLKNVRPAHYKQLESGTLRLVDPKQMGLLFKAMALLSSNLPPPSPFNVEKSEYLLD